MASFPPRLASRTSCTDSTKGEALRLCQKTGFYVQYVAQRSTQPHALDAYAQADEIETRGPKPIKRFSLAIGLRHPGQGHVTDAGVTMQAGGSVRDTPIGARNIGVGHGLSPDLSAGVITTYEMFGAQLTRGWRRGPAFFGGERAPGVEVATLGRVQR